MTHPIGVGTFIMQTMIDTLNQTQNRMHTRTLVRRVILLSRFTIGYNLIEGIVSIGFGLGDESVALAGFGADSLIEVASAFIVLWRFQKEIESHTFQGIKRERRATYAIGLLFICLASITALASLTQLIQGNHPETTLPGMIISSLSLSFMYFLWSSKRRLGKALNSSTVMKDASCSLACIKLSFVLFLGSLLFLILPQAWWIDALAAIVLAFFMAKEGWETLESVRKPEFSGGCGCVHTD